MEKTRAALSKTQSKSPSHSNQSFARPDPKFALLQWKLFASCMQAIQYAVLIVRISPKWRQQEDTDLSCN